MPRSSIFRLTVALALLLAAAPPLAAQRGHQRKGLWSGVGIGVGSVQLSCQICKGGRDGSFTGFGQIGFAATPTLLLGAEVALWYDDGAVDRAIGALEAVTQFYPRKASGLFLKAGIGLMEYRAKDSQDEASVKALAGQIGVGFDLPITSTIAIAPYLNLHGSTSGNLRFNNTVSSQSISTSLFQAGMVLSFH